MQKRLFCVFLLLAGAIGQIGGNARADKPEALKGDLVGRLDDGRIVQGSDLVGAKLKLGSGAAAIRVRLAAIVVEKDLVGDRLPLYDLRIMGGDGGEQPLCNADAEGRRLAVLLAGTNRDDTSFSIGTPDQLQFVCMAGAEGKCVRFGYAPWKTDSDNPALPVRLFNACIRMLRADYCGDGRSFTRNGVLIAYQPGGEGRADEMEDDEGLPPGFSFEAAWTERGASCVARTRLPGLADLDGLAAACPRLRGHLGTPACRPGTAESLLDSFSR